MNAISNDEWAVLTGLLPAGWEQAARDCGAFRRARYLQEPGALLRLLLFHAVADGGLRETVAQARAAGIADMSPVALFKRMRTSGSWLAWIGAALCRSWREAPRLPEAMRLRAVDSTTVQGPASKSSEWRVHYALDLNSLNCDWFELTDAQGAEQLERTPMSAGDVMLADRNYLRGEGVAAARACGAHVVIRMRWKAKLQDHHGQSFDTLRHARRLKVGKVGAWPAQLPVKGAAAIAGRVIAMRLPAPLAAKAAQRAERRSLRHGSKPDPRSIEAAKYVLLFTTLPESLLQPDEIMQLYRYRWQIELAFKRMKQLLKLGRLPHQDKLAAQAWIHAKLVIALLLETLFRNARTLSPWGYRIAHH